MAEIGHGYGSEFQLLRMLGHHRNFLNKQIQTVLNTDLEICWADYPIDDKRISLDGEWKGIDFIFSDDNIKLKEIQQRWNLYWPSSTKCQNWDGIFKVGDVWYFVEAKAHASEVKSSCSAKSEESREKIIKAFEKTNKWLNGTGDVRRWVESDFNSYQLANRFAFIHFCETNEIKAKLFYISFINGYKEESVKTIAEWNEIWNKEYEELGITKESVKDILYHLSINCCDDKMNILFNLKNAKGFTDEEFIERYDDLHEKAWHYRDEIKAYQEKNKNYRDDAFDKYNAEMRYNLGCGEVIDIDKASENEVWKKLTNSGYTKYAVSSLGRVAFLRRDNYYIIKQDDFQTKYYLRLTPDEKFHVDRQIEVYKLIAMGFLGKNIGDGYDVHHIINDGYNCCPDNLILLSRKQHNAVHNSRKLEGKELREFLKD